MRKVKRFHADVLTYNFCIADKYKINVYILYGVHMIKQYEINKRLHDRAKRG